MDPLEIVWFLVKLLFWYWVAWPIAWGVEKAVLATAGFDLHPHFSTLRMAVFVIIFSASLLKLDIKGAVKRSLCFLFGAIKKTIWLIFRLVVLYWVAGSIAYSFGSGLYFFTRINLFAHLLSLRILFFVLLCPIAVFWKPIVAWFQGLAHRDLSSSGPADTLTAWQEAGLFLTVVFFLHLRLYDAFLAVQRFYINHSSPAANRPMKVSGILVFLAVLAVSIPLAVLLTFLLHRSSRLQSAAPILALICAALAVLALVLPSGGEISMEEFVVNQISPISFPDKDVLEWALPSLVLAYFGRQAVSFQAQNRQAKLLSYSAIALSCTFAGDLLGLAGAFTFSRF